MNTLLANAVAAIRLGVEDFQSTDSARLISAVRNITAGVLLLFKEKLRQMSPPNSDEVLLKERLRPAISKSGQITFVGIGRKTVDVQQIKERFKSLDVSVDWKRVDQLVQLRNDLEHYYTMASLAAVQGAIADAFAVLQSFVTVELNVEPLDLLGEPTWHALLAQSYVFEVQRAACRSELEKINWPDAVYADVVVEIRCVRCHSELVKPVDVDVKDILSLDFQCTSCGEISQFDDAVGDAIAAAFAGEAYIAMTDGGDPPIVSCHECGQYAFHLKNVVCLLCRGTLRYTECAVCSDSLGPEDQENSGLCGYHKWQAEKDE